MTEGEGVEESVAREERVTPPPLPPPPREAVAEGVLAGPRDTLTPGVMVGAGDTKVRLETEGELEGLGEVVVVGERVEKG